MVQHNCSAGGRLQAECMLCTLSSHAEMAVGVLLSLYGKLLLALSFFMNKESFMDDFSLITLSSVQLRRGYWRPVLFCVDLDLRE